MKIGIIELDHHRECLNSLCQLLEHGGHSVTVFTTRNIYKELAPFSYVPKFNWHISDVSNARFIAGHKDELNSQDLLIFSTVESEFKTWNAVQLKTKRLIRIHNANTFLAKKRSWFFKPSLYWLYKDTSYFVRKIMAENEHAERQRFVAESDYICFTSQEITNHILNENQSFLHTEKIVAPVPITFNEFEPKTHQNARVFAVIGTIDRKRKDYDILYRVFEEVGQHLKGSVELKFLGKPKGAFGKRALKMFDNLQNVRLKVYSWPNGVPQKEFDAEMKSVDIILAPIFEETKYFLNKEYYGLTKISGSINDVIKYARTAVIPNFYPVTSGESLFIRYKSESELKQVILELLKGDLKPKILKKDLEPFSLESASKKLNAQLKELMN